MPTYRAPTRDCRFILHEVLRLENYGNLPPFENASADVTDAILEEAGRFAAEVLAPLNQVGDAQGCTHRPDGNVTTPEGFKEAFDAYNAAAWGTLTASADFGGQGLPHAIGFAVKEFFSSANQS